MKKEIRKQIGEPETKHVLADVADVDDFDWQEIGIDDFICNISDEYSLRVERMSKWRWWWAVYFKDKQIFTKKDSVLKCSKDYAMGLCEGVYLAHCISSQ